eukprot:s2099_g12.t1
MLFFKLNLFKLKKEHEECRLLLLGGKIQDFWNFISLTDSLATLRFCESVKQVRTKPALPVSQREAVVIELQEEVRRLELELLRARSGRAIVERQLGEAQARA